MTDSRLVPQDYPAAFIRPAASKVAVTQRALEKSPHSSSEPSSQSGLSAVACRLSPATCCCLLLPLCPFWRVFDESRKSIQSMTALRLSFLTSSPPSSSPSLKIDTTTNEIIAIDAIRPISTPISGTQSRRVRRSHLTTHFHPGLTCAIHA